ncbi:MAG: group II truncated hemoglobin [Acidimicrobiia bacterium]|nr:group II truncated hemoglobin [Acidimicrobiia bacterium]
MLPDPQPAGRHPWGDEPNPYAELGGESVLRRLVDRFYDRIDAEAPVLRAMLPADDSNSRRNLFEFLSGWMGGPQLYTQRKGHPRLRMRHAPYPIGAEEAREWMRCMREALDDVAVRDPLRGYLEVRLAQTAEHVRNRD